MTPLKWKSRGRLFNVLQLGLSHPCFLCYYLQDAAAQSLFVNNICAYVQMR